MNVQPKIISPVLLNATAMFKRGQCFGYPCTWAELRELSLRDYVKVARPSSKAIAEFFYLQVVAITSDYLVGAVVTPQTFDILGADCIKFCHDNVFQIRRRAD